MTEKSLEDVKKIEPFFSLLQVEKTESFFKFFQNPVMYDEDDEEEEDVEEVRGHCCWGRTTVHAARAPVPLVG